MQGVVEPSKLCKDIFELEKDFRYNLFLLKVRDTEIARCRTQNDQLIRDLKQREENKTAILVKLRDLESELKSTNNEKTSMKISYEETIASLSDSLKELRNTHENYVREQRSLEKKRDLEFQERCKEILESKEKEHGREMAEMNDRLDREMALSQNLKQQLKEMTTRNISLRNEFQEKQSNYISKISILESELKSAQGEKNNLQIKLDADKKSCTFFETELKRTITEKDQLKQELSESDERNTNCQRNLNEISSEKDNLKHQLNTITQELETCKANLERIKEEKGKLQKEFECYKGISQEQQCTKPEHEKIDTILKQNSILQEVVKSMRRERSEVLDTQEMERKMERLEGLVQCLKASMLNECEVMSTITSNVQ